MTDKKYHKTIMHIVVLLSGLMAGESALSQAITVNMENCTPMSNAESCPSSDTQCFIDGNCCSGLTVSEGNCSVYTISPPSPAAQTTVIPPSAPNRNNIDTAYWLVPVALLAWGWNYDDDYHEFSITPYGTGKHNKRGSNADIGAVMKLNRQNFDFYWDTNISKDRGMEIWHNSIWKNEFMDIELNQNQRNHYHGSNLSLSPHYNPYQWRIQYGFNITIQNDRNSNSDKTTNNVYFNINGSWGRYANEIKYGINIPYASSKYGEIEVKYNYNLY